MLKLAAAIVLVLATAAPAAARQTQQTQQTMSQVLSFLLTNRSVSTGDFSRDEAAAAATRDTFATFIQTELATIPVTSPSSGFTYRLDPTIGANVRASDSFGPFYVERALTGGKRQVTFSVSYSQTAFDNIDGLALRTGTLVAIATQLDGESQPFDAETLTLRIQTRTTTFSGHIGLTDRLDFSGAVPVVSLSMSGDRVDTTHGVPFPQASAVASASGLGDVLLRAKYNVLRSGASGVSVGTDIRLPTGNADNFLGSGHTIGVPRLIGSLEHDWIGLQGEVGYAVGGPVRQVEYGGAATIVASPRLTLVAEVLGSRLGSGGSLVYLTEARPGLVGVNTIRLTGATSSTTRVSVVAGFRWNIAGKWLLSANVLRPVTTAGLNAKWVPTMTFDYSMGR
jgi:hypothetical protein